MLGGTVTAVTMGGLPAVGGIAAAAGSGIYLSTKQLWGKTKKMAKKKNLKSSKK
jgi:hypothetical protein